ncbi:MAG: hypothetical protein ACFFGZ_12640 [Candidatus Thorarchaeota archaeon]
MSRVQNCFLATLCTFLLLSANITILTSGQTEASRKPHLSIEWIEVWPGTENVSISLLGISEGPDESVYMAQCRKEWVENDSSVPTLAATRFDKKGAIIWEKEILASRPWYDSPYSMRAVSCNLTGALYLVGAIGNASDADAVVLRMEPNGSLAWEYSWGNYDRDQFFAATIDNAGNVIAVGGARPSGAEHFTNGTLIKLSPNGELLWTYIWNENLWTYTWNESGSAYGTVFNSVVVGKTGDIYVVGRRVTEYAYTAEGLVAKFDSSGELLWNVTCKPKYGGIWSRDLSIIDSAERDAGGILVLGAIFSRVSGPSSHEFFSMAFHDNGSQEEGQIWAWTPYTEDGLAELTLSDLASFENEEFIALGSLMVNTFVSEPPYLHQNDSLALFFLDQNGQEITNETWSQPANLRGERIIQITPNAYYICGRVTDQYQQTNEWFMARFEIEWERPMGSQSVLVRLLVGSMIVISIIGTILGVFVLLGRKYQRK